MAEAAQAAAPEAVAAALEGVGLRALRCIAERPGDGATRGGRRAAPPALPRLCGSGAQRLRSLQMLAKVLNVAAIALPLIHAGRYCTERDVLYSAPGLYAHQPAAVSRAIHRLCAWVNACLPRGSGPGPGRCIAACTRETLRITATGKSVLVGHVEFECDPAAHLGAPCAPPPPSESHGMVRYAPLREGVIITARLAVGACHFRPARAGAADGLCVVLVEKEATLQHLVHVERALQELAVCFLCTKGYPCAASRALLQRMYRERGPRGPVRLLALTDGDPHGLTIAMTWMGLCGHAAPYGAAGGGTSLDVAEHLLPIQWLGISPSGAGPAGGAPGPEHLAPLSRSDVRRLASLRQRIGAALAAVDAADRDGGAAAPSRHMRDLRHSLGTLQRAVRDMSSNQVKCLLHAAPYRLLSLLRSALQNAPP